MWRNATPAPVVNEVAEATESAAPEPAETADEQMGSCEINGQHISFKRVSIDTRTMQPTDLLIALKGERFDAHDFLPKLQLGQGRRRIGRARARRLCDSAHHRG